MRDDYKDGCALCGRYMGDLYYKRHDLHDLARRLARKPTEELATKARVLKAEIAATQKTYDEHLAVDHEEVA